MNSARLLRVAFLASAFAVSLWWAFGIASGIAALAGALAGGILQIRGFFDSGRKGLRWGIAGGALTALVILSPWVGIVFPSSLAVIFPNACTAIAVSFICAVVLQSLCERFPGWRIFESLILGLLFCLPFLASKGGQFTRPQWLADRVVERGLSPSLILACLGMIVAIASVALQPNAKEPNSSAPRSRLRKFSALLLALILGAFLAWEAFLLVGSVKTRPEANPPPVSFAGDPPPPPPPQPEPLAAIQFGKIHTPVKRLGGFFFRINEETSAPGEIPPGVEVVETKIYYLDKSIGTVSLAGHSKFESLPPPGRRFQKAERIETIVPSEFDKSDFKEKKVRSICEINLQAQDLEPAPAEVAELVERIKSGISGSTKAASGSFIEEIQKAVQNKPERAQALLLQAMAMVDWLEQNGDFSGGNKTQEAQPIADFVKGGLKGNSADFARLAAAMLKSQGIKARLAEGFFHPLESIPIDFMVLTDSHRDTWVEVLTAKGDWIILPIRPAKVSDREPPPPQEDLKQELFDEIEKGPAPQQAPSGATVTRPAPQSIFIPLALVTFSAVILWWLITFFGMPIQRICKAADQSNRQMLGEASIRASAVFRPRHFGESWEAYAYNMASTMPRLSRRFVKILDLQKKGSISRSQSARAYSAFALAVSFSLERFQLRKKQNPTPKTQP